MSVYSAAVLTANPVLYWQLNESVGSSQVTDYGSFGLNGTVGSAFTLGSTPILGSDSRTSLSMPGNPNNVNKLVQSVFDSRLELTQYITLEFVYQPNGFSPSGGPNIVSIGANHSTNGPAIAQLPNGQIQFYVDYTSAYTSAYITSNTNLISGQTYHIAGTFDGSTIKIYIDGVLDNSTAYSGPIGGYDGIHGFAIGNGNIVGGPNSAPGSIQDTAIYNYALSSTTIAAHSKIALGYLNSNYEQLVQQSNPLLFWPLGDPIGYPFAIDYGPYGLNGTVGSSLTLGSTELVTSEGDTTTSLSMPGGAYSASKLVTSVQSSYIQPTSDLTIEWFIKLKAYPNGLVGLLGVGYLAGSTTYGFQININPNGTITFYVGFSNAQNVTSNTVFNLNTKYYVACTYDGATMKIYVNGILDNSLTYTGAITGYNGTTGFVIGDNYPQRPDTFNGNLEYVALYETALSDSTIYLHSLNNFIPTSPSKQYILYVNNLDPIAFYPLQETNGTIAYDISGNNYNANVINTVTLGATGTAFGTSAQSAEFYSAYEFNSTPLTGFVDIGNQIVYTGSSSNRVNYPGSGNELGVYFLSGWITFWMRAIAPNTGGGMLVYINNAGMYVDDFGNLGFYQENSSNYSGPVSFNIVGSNVMDGQDHFIAFQYTKGYYQASGNAAGFNSTNVTYNLNIYVDGNQIYNQQAFSYHTSNPSQDSSMVQTNSSIGAFYDGTQLFNGYIKLVTLFDYASQFNPVTMFELGYAYITYTNQLDYIPQLLDYNILNVVAGKLIDAPSSGISNFQIVPLGLEESLRLDYLNILQQTRICPTPNAPIIIPIGYVYGSTSAFAPGNYYRVPVDTTMVVDNQIIPKYFNNFTYPISTFVYPSTSEYNGLMLVKSSSYTGSLPNDIIQLSGTQVVADLITYAHEIFVF
jgi:hypothetical protein